MLRTKLLYDIEQLITSQGKETGICRVSLEILKQLSKETSYDVYPLVTTYKGCDAGEYLTSKGLGSLANKVVYMPFLKKTTQNYNWYQKLCSFAKILKYKNTYNKELNKYDEYISIFSPISPIVYKNKIKTKLIIHDLIPIRFPQYCTKKFAAKYKKWIEAINADEVFCVSEATKKDLLVYRPDLSDKIKIAYLAANSNFVSTQTNVKEKYKIETPKYFLAVSDHNPRKNFLHLIEAFIEFLKHTKVDDVSLAIIGPQARDTKNIQTLLSKNPEYKNKIHVTGFVDDKDMPAMYSNAEAFIYPSLYEGFGLPPLEAMSCGCPVICSNNSSLPEVAGDAAVYISGTDVKETSSKIQEIYNNTNQKTLMIEKGKVQSQKFNWAKTVQQIFY